MALFLNSPCRCTSRWHASPAWVSCQNKANSWLSGWLSCAMCFVVVHFSGRTTLVSSSEALVIAGLFTWANSPFQANLYFVYICFYFHCEEVVRATYASFLFSFTLLSRKSVQPARRQNNFRSRRSGILCVGVYHFSWVSSAIHSKLDQVYVVVCSHNNQVKCKRNCNKSVLFQTKKKQVLWENEQQNKFNKSMERRWIQTGQALHSLAGTRFRWWNSRSDSRRKRWDRGTKAASRVWFNLSRKRRKINHRSWKRGGGDCVASERRNPV